MAVGVIDLVLERVGLLIREAEHTDINLDSRIIGEEHDQTGSQADIDRIILLVSTAKILTDTLGKFGDTATHFELDLIEETETFGITEREIIAHEDRAIIIMGEGIDMVEIHTGFGIEHEVGISEFKERTLIGELCAEDPIVTYSESHHWGNLKRICIGIDILEDNKLIIILIGLGIRERESGDPLPLRDKHGLLDLMFKRDDLMSISDTDRIDYSGVKMDGIGKRVLTLSA